MKQTPRSAKGGGSSAGAAPATQTLPKQVRPAYPSHGSSSGQGLHARVRPHAGRHSRTILQDTNTPQQ
jgi:hypothetical protein